jgi:predicted aspartyl protease
MGTFTTRVGIGHHQGGDFQWIDALVDTGAVHSVMPAAMLRRIGIQPDYERVFTYADGRKSKLSVGQARISVERKAGFSPVVFGEDERYLLGATTLQVLDLIADTSNHKLIPAPELTI